MPLKPGKTIDEICYPFIYETSYLCDFEVVTDELCGLIGAVIALLPEKFNDIYQDLDTLQPLVFHLNGSIRGKLAVQEEDLNWLLQRYHHYKELTAECTNGFVLPCGPQPVAQLNQARSAAKKAIRSMVRIDQEGIEVPEVLHRFCNLMCNYFFVLILYINKTLNIQEVPFISKSYRLKK